MESVEGLGALAREVVSSVGEQPKGGGVVLGGDGGETVVVECGDADRDRVGPVVLAAVPGGQEPDSSRELGGE